MAFQPLIRPVGLVRFSLTRRGSGRRLIADMISHLDIASSFEHPADQTRQQAAITSQSNAVNASSGFANAPSYASIVEQSVGARGQSVGTETGL